MGVSPKNVQRRLNIEIAERLNHYRLDSLARQVAAHAPSLAGEKPVAFFRASTGIRRMNLNNAFHQLPAWSLRLQGIPAVHFICGSGMSRCVLGTDRAHPQAEMPCRQCTQLSRRLAGRALQEIFPFHGESGLEALSRERNVGELAQLEWGGLPLGQIVLPSLRWVLRRHNLDDDQATRFLFREYLLSAWNVYREACAFLDQVRPRALVVFNGMFFPEAVARRAAGQRGIPSFSHEVGMLPFSAFFTGGEATAYPLEIPSGFELTPGQEGRLDAYLRERFKGDFSMAGIRFWPEMHGLDESFLRRAAGFRQIVPVFTNVIFDTSQPHSNTVFPDMFAWLEAVLQLVQQHPETLFVIRAHPDEKRRGKESHETVSEWLERHPLKGLPNLVFYDALEYVSSYELIQRSKFVMVYNSSIGLEASILGKGVLSGGRSRYTGYPTVFFPPTPEAYHQQAETFLSAGQVELPVEFQQNSRRFLYYQLFRSSLPFGRFLKAHPLPGFVQLRSFSWEDLLPQNAPALRVISEGLIQGKPFLLEAD
jgi:hypothetical protein